MEIGLIILSYIFFYPLVFLITYAVNDIQRMNEIEEVDFHYWKSIEIERKYENIFKQDLLVNSLIYLIILALLILILLL